MNVCPPRNHRPTMLQQRLRTWLSCVLPTHRQGPDMLWLPISQWRLQVGFLKCCSSKPVFVFPLSFLPFFFTYISCILILSMFFYSPTDAQVNCLKTILSLLPNSVTYTHQQGHINICSHIITHRCILIGYFNNCNFSKHE